MSTSAPAAPAEPPDPVPHGGRLGAGETTVVVTAIAAVTALAVLQRPIPAALVALVSAATLLLVPARPRQLIGAFIRAFIHAFTGGRE